MSEWQILVIFNRILEKCKAIVNCLLIKNQKSSSSFGFRYIEYKSWIQQELVEDYRQAWLSDPQVQAMTPIAFFQTFERMGLQRHLKCAGIFSRLCLRDGKSRYLNDIPMVMKYVATVCQSQPEFRDFFQWLQAFVLPDPMGRST